MSQNPYEMLYCDDAQCRVNTFEAGTQGTCPGCTKPGYEIPTRN